MTKIGPLEVSVLSLIFRVCTELYKTVYNILRRPAKWAAPTKAKDCSNIPSSAVK